MRKAHIMKFQIGARKALLALALLLVGVAQATAGPISSGGTGYSGGGSSGGADPMFTFTYTDGINIASGTINTTALGGGAFWATSGSLTVSSGLAAGTYTLFPGGPPVTTSPDGLWIYDNVVYCPPLLIGGPSVDNAGLLFLDATGREVNIFGNGGPSNYSLDASDPSFGYTILGTSGTFTLSDCPEPASMTLLGIGITGMAGYGWRRRKQAATK
jgi:PEP-CTERM motif